MHGVEAKRRLLSVISKGKEVEDNAENAEKCRAEKRERLTTEDGDRTESGKATRKPSQSRLTVPDSQRSTQEKKI